MNWNYGCFRNYYNTCSNYLPNQTGTLSGEPICRRTSGTSGSPDLSSLHLTKEQCQAYANSKSISFLERRTDIHPGGCSRNKDKPSPYIFYNSNTNHDRLNSDCVSNSWNYCIHKCSY